MISHISQADRKAQRLNRGGVAAVESTFVLLILVTMLLSLLDMGLSVCRFNSLGETARRIARAAIVRGQDGPPETTSWGPATVTGTAADATEFGVLARRTLVTMAPSAVQFNIEWPDGGNRENDRVYVSLSYQHNPIVPMVWGGTRQLTAATTMRIVN